MSPQPNYQSIRSSCERCRSQKLKCTISAENSRSGIYQCVRCTRAKVECVFRQRAQARRTSDARRANREYTETGIKMSEADFLQTLLETSSPIVPEPLPTFAPGSPLWSTDTWFDDSACAPREHVNSNNNDILNNNILINDTELLASAQGLQDTSGLFDLTALESLNTSVPCIHNEDMAAWSGTSSTGEGEEVQSTWSKTSENDNPQAIVQLSALVAEIHEALSMLAGGSWANTNNPSNLNSYPIGHVLNLAQKFVTALRNFWATTSVQNGQQISTSNMGGHMGPGASPSSLQELPTPMTTHADRFSSLKMAQGQSAPADSTTTPSPMALTGAVDMSTMLLVLSCYISLTKLYITVFTQIETHLSVLPVVQERRLQPAELTLANETCSKMYMAVQMLLDEFQSVKDIVGLPNLLSLVRQQTNGGGSGELEVELKKSSLWFISQLELGRSMLGQDVNRVQNCESQEISGLLRKGQHLKALLREKMNPILWETARGQRRCR